MFRLVSCSSYYFLTFSFATVLGYFAFEMKESSSSKKPSTTGLKSESATWTVHLGALTTAFTPPTPCKTGFANANQDGDLESYRLGQSWDPTLLNTDYATSCFPSLLVEAYSDNYRGVTQTMSPIFSPGLACPTGWNVAWSMNSGGKQPVPDVDDYAISTILKKGESFIRCCPK